MKKLPYWPSFSTSNRKIRIQSNLTFETEGVTDTKVGYRNSVVKVSVHILQLKESIQIEIAHWVITGEVIG